MICKQWKLNGILISTLSRHTDRLDGAGVRTAVSRSAACPSELARNKVARNAPCDYACLVYGLGSQRAEWHVSPRTCADSAAPTRS